MKKLKSISMILTALLFLQVLPIFGITAYAADPQANFTDPNLDAAIHTWMGKAPGTPILQSEIQAKLQGSSDKLLQLISKNISSLAGMEIFNGLPLEALQIDLNNITDLSPIAGITSLKQLNAGYNQISDLTPISGLSNLNILGLSDNQISNLSPLAGVTSLTSLNLGNNQISNLTPLSGLTNMQYLILENNQISNITPLSGLTQMIQLTLTKNQITDITPVTNMTSLTDLFLGYNTISNVAPVNGLVNLQNLNLENNQISNIGPLSGITTSMKQLWLGRNQISDVSPLSGMTNLEYLNAWWNQIADVTPIANLTNLTQLLLNFNQIGDISSLSTLNKLETLWINNQTVLFGTSGTLFSLNGVQGMTALQTLEASGNQIKDVTPIVGLANLQDLRLNNNWLTDITDLISLPALTTINVRYNYIDVWSGGSKTFIESKAWAWSQKAPQYRLVFADGVPGGGSVSTINSLSVEVGQTKPVVVAYEQTSDGATFTLNGGSSFEVWTNSDSSKATLQDDADPMAKNVKSMKGVAVGSTTLNAKLASNSVGYGVASLPVSVTAATVTLQSITVTPATATVVVGGTQQYTATANFSDGSTQDVTNSAVWALGDPTKATINASGLATGSAAGTTGVTATWNGMTGNASLTVTAPVTLQSISVIPATATVAVGGTQQYTAIANFSDGSTQDVTNSATWALGDPTKATINATGLATGTALGTTGVTATWSGMTGNASLTVAAAPVTLQSITVTPATATVAVGGTQQYTATANFSDGSTQDVTNAAAWMLQFPAMASINASGLATGNAVGTTGVAATWNGMTGFASLTVTAAPVPVTLQSITVTPATATIQVGNTQQYNATANFSDGSTQDVTNTAAWALGDPTKAAINASGLATGSAAGTTGVTATWNGLTGNASLIVTAAPVTPPTGGGSSDPTLQSITVTPATATVQVGETQQYTATANYSDGSKKDVTNSAAWTLGDPTKATINASGLATGTAAGTTSVTATWGGMTGNANLTVTALPVKITKLEVTPKEATIFTGEIQEYVAIAYYSDSTKKDVTKDASWTISDSSIASIAKGKAKGISAGKTGVKAEFEGLNDTAKLTVQDMPVEIKVYQDLTPQLAAPEQVTAGDKFNLKVALRNIGDEDVTDEFTANVYVRKVDDKKSGGVTIASADAEGWTLLKSYVVKSGLKAGATMNFEVPLQLLEKGIYEIKVIADEDSITADVDRSNNQDQKVTIAVKEEEPVTVPEQPRIPKTGDGSVIETKQSNVPAYALLASVLAIMAFVVRRWTRKKEQ